MEDLAVIAAAAAVAFIPKKPYRAPPKPNMSKSTPCLDQMSTKCPREISNTYTKANTTSAAHASYNLREEMEYLDRYNIH